ncbi:MAG: hypothetical protein SGI86_09755 [Deltaproteobacteria bacterium]|nr:hypothetical protein [Deltaproteobacteria bacterium]
MKKDISRKQFLAIGFGAVGTAIASCSSGGGRGGSGAGGSAAGSDGNGGSSGSGGGSGSKTGVTSGKTGGTSGSKTGGSGGSGTGTGGTGTGGSGTGGSGTGGSKMGGMGGTASTGGTGGTSAGNMCSAKIVATISNNHGHALEIPMADITAGVTKCYNAKGTSQHDHYLTVTAANFTTLKGGGVVKVFSCNGGDHEYVLSCVAGAPAAAAPVCPNETPGSVACAA